MNGRAAKPKPSFQTAVWLQCCIGCAMADSSTPFSIREVCTIQACGLPRCNDLETILSLGNALRKETVRYYRWPEVPTESARLRSGYLDGDHLHWDARPGWQNVG